MEFGAQVQVLRVAFEGNIKEFLLLFFVQFKFALQLIEIVSELLSEMLDLTFSNLALFIDNLAYFIYVVYSVFHKKGLAHISPLLLHLIRKCVDCGSHLAQLLFADLHSLQERQVYVFNDLLNLS